MIKRVSVLALACLAVLSVQAQGIRLPHASLGSTPRPAVVDSSPKQADYIVAVVNSEPVTNNEVRQRAARALQQLAQQGITPPSMDQVLHQTLERIINEKAQAQVAVENGLKIEDSSVDLAEQNVARQNQMTVEQLHRRLTQDGMTVAQLREDLRNQLLLARVREREVEPRVKITDADIDQYLQDQLAAQASSGGEVDIAQILVAVPESASASEVAELKARAERILNQARSGTDFAQLARDYSDGLDREKGGDLGLRPTDRYPELFVSGVQGLPINGLAGPLRSGAGFHILKLLDRKGGQAQGLTITQSHARHILLRTGPKLTEAAAIAQIEGYRQRIVDGGASFADVAREHSQDGSAKQGGDLGWANPGQFVPEFEEALDALQPGQVSAPVVSRFGVHLIQLVERREQPLSTRDQRELARNALREKKMDEAFVSWAQEVRARAYVEFRDPPQ